MPDRTRLGKKRIDRKDRLQPTRYPMTNLELMFFVLLVAYCLGIFVHFFCPGERPHTCNDPLFGTRPVQRDFFNSDIESRNRWKTDVILMSEGVSPYGNTRLYRADVFFATPKANPRHTPSRQTRLECCPEEACT
jgi:hypothetical protein